jgi:chemotaxis protein MotB
MKPSNIEDLEIHNSQPYRSSKHRHEEEHMEEHHEGEPWLVSYADMMTLLFCFFVIMTSFANFDPVVVTKKSKEVADYIHGEDDTGETVVKKLEQDVASNSELKGIAVATVKEGTLEVVFSSTILFPSGGEKVEGDFYKNIDILIGLIKNRNADYRVIIEGHTDINDTAIGEDKKQYSSWALSASRAAHVVDRFIFNGFSPNQLVSVGYGDSHPVAPSFDKEGQVIAENQALNRRVVIKVLQPLKGVQNKKLKMDNYFENTEILEK